MNMGGTQRFQIVRPSEAGKLAICELQIIRGSMLTCTPEEFHLMHPAAIDMRGQRLEPDNGGNREERRRRDCLGLGLNAPLALIRRLAQKPLL